MNENITHIYEIITFFVILGFCGYYLMKWTKRINQYDPTKKKNVSRIDCLHKRNEDRNVVGGTNLDRFFIECVLSECTDFSKEKNIEKARLYADKYNLEYPSGVEKLYNEAFEAHKKINKKINDLKLKENLAKKREEEKNMYNRLIRYSDYYGRDKKKAMLRDQMKLLRDKAKSLDNSANTMLNSGLQKEHDWALYGGIANGLGGLGAGLSTAYDLQSKNASIREQNDAYIRRTLPAYMSISSNASKNRESK
jgi:hypothetical protein